MASEGPFSRARLCIVPTVCVSIILDWSRHRCTHSAATVKQQHRSLYSTWRKSIFTVRSINQTCEQSHPRRYLARVSLRLSSVRRRRRRRKKSIKGGGGESFTARGHNKTQPTMYRGDGVCNVCPVHEESARSSERSSKEKWLVRCVAASVCLSLPGETADNAISAPFPQFRISIRTHFYTHSDRAMRGRKGGRIGREQKQCSKEKFAIEIERRGVNQMVRTLSLDAFGVGVDVVVGLDLQYSAPRALHERANSAHEWILARRHQEASVPKKPWEKLSAFFLCQHLCCGILATKRPLEFGPFKKVGGGFP